MSDQFIDRVGVAASVVVERRMGDLDSVMIHDAKYERVLARVDSRDR